MYNICSGVIWWKMHDILSYSNSNLCPIFHQLHGIHKTNKMPESLTWKMKLKVENEINETCTIRFEMFNSISVGNIFIIWSTWEDMFMQKVTHTHTHVRTYARTHTHTRTHARTHTNTHTHTHTRTHIHTLTYTQRETGVMTISKICKADLSKKYQQLL